MALSETHISDHISGGSAWVKLQPWWDRMAVHIIKIIAGMAVLVTARQSIASSFVSCLPVINRTNTFGNVTAFPAISNPEYQFVNRECASQLGVEVVYFPWILLAEIICLALPFVLWTYYPGIKILDEFHVIITEILNSPWNVRAVLDILSEKNQEKLEKDFQHVEGWQKKAWSFRTEILKKQHELLIMYTAKISVQFLIGITVLVINSVIVTKSNFSGDFSCVLPDEERLDLVRLKIANYFACKHDFGLFFEIVMSTFILFVVLYLIFTIRGLWWLGKTASQSFILHGESLKLEPRVVKQPKGQEPQSEFIQTDGDQELSEQTSTHSSPRTSTPKRASVAMDTESSTHPLLTEERENFDVTNPVCEKSSSQLNIGPVLKETAINLGQSSENTGIDETRSEPSLGQPPNHDQSTCEEWLDIFKHDLALMMHFYQNSKPFTSDMERVAHYMSKVFKQRIESIVFSPGDIKVKWVNETGVCLVWDGPLVGPYTDFKVMWEPKTYPEAHIQVCANAKQKSRTICGLLPAVKYTFWVYTLAERDGKILSSEQVCKVSVATTPSKPKDFRLEHEQSTTDTLVISWKFPRGWPHTNQSFCGYNLMQCEYDQPEGRYREDLIPLPSERIERISYKLTRRQPGTRYRLLLEEVLDFRNDESKPYTQDTDVIRSLERAEIIAVTVPDAVTNIFITQVSSTSLSVSWQAPNGHADRYVACCSKMNTNKYSGERLMEAVVITNSTTFEPLVPGTAHEISVVAESCIINTASDATQSRQYIQGAATHTEKFTLPEEVSNIRVVSRATDSLTLAWDRAAGELNGYEIWYHALQQVESKMESLQTDSADSCEICLDKLNPGTLYAIKVASFRKTENLNGSPEDEGGSTADLDPPEYGTPVVIKEPTVPSSVDLSRVQCSSTTTSIIINWHDCGASEYLISYKEDGEKSKRQLVPAIGKALYLGAQMQTTIEKLRPGTKYTFYIKCRQYGLDSKEIKCLTCTDPVPPENIVQKEIDGENEKINKTNALKISWSEPDGLWDNFKIYGTLDGELKLSPTATEQQATLCPLVPGKKYEVSVASVSNGKESTLIKKYFSTVPATPERFITVGKPETNSASFEWDSPECGGIDWYRLEISNTITTERKVQHQIHDTVRKVEQLESGCIYLFRLYSVSNGLHSKPADLEWITKPSVPQVLQIVPSTKTVQLVWRLQLGHAERYNIYKGDELIESVEAVKLENPMFVIQDLKPGTPYCGTVKAVTKDLESDPVHWSTHTVPAKATNVRCISKTRRSSVLAWDKPDGSIGNYRLKYWPKRNPDRPEVKETIGDETSIELGGLASGTEYYVQLFTCSNDIYSEGTCDFNFTTVPNPPKGLVVKSKDSTTVQLEVIIPDGGYDGFRVKCPSLTLDDVQKEPTVIKSSLTPGTEYLFTVLSCVEDGTCSDGHVDLYVWTDPDAPGNVRQTETKGYFSANTGKIIWDKPKGNFSNFIIQYHAEEGPVMPEIKTQGDECCCILSNLTEGTIYKSLVYTQLRNDVRSQPSHSCTIFTAPGKPGKISEVLVKPTGIDFIIGRSPGKVEKYLATIDVDSCKPKEILSDGELLCSFDGLNAGTEYRLSITAEINNIKSEAYKYTFITEPGKPGKISTKSSSIEDLSTTIQFEWECSEGKVDHYEILYGPLNGVLTTLRTKSGTDSTCEIPDLKPSTTYSIEVFAVSHGKRSTSSTFTQETDIAKPKDVSVEYGTRQLCLKWYHKDFENFLRYEIVCGPRNGKKSEIRQEKTFTGSHILKGLTPGTVYSIKIKTVAEKSLFESAGAALKTFLGHSPATEIEHATDPEIPKVPYWVKSQLCWNKPDGNVSYYNVSYTLRGEPVTRDTEDMSFHFEDGEIEEQVIHDIAVVAVSNGRKSKPCKIDLPLKTPSLYVDKVGPTTVTLKWQQDKDRSVKYNLKYCKKGGMEVNVPNPTREYTSPCKISDLKPGTNYCFTLTALKGIKSSEKCTKEVVTVPAKPGKIKLDSKRTSTGKPGVTYIEWDAPVIQYGNVEVEKYNVRYKAKVNNVIHGPFETYSETYEVAGLISGVKYEFSVTAIAGGKESEKETGIIITRPLPVQNLTIRQDKEHVRTATTSWEKPSGRGYIDKYYVHYKPLDEYTLTAFKRSCTTTSHTERTLCPGTKYVVNVESIVCIDGKEYSSGEGESQELITNPEPLTSLIVTQCHGRSTVLVQWQGPSRYSVDRYVIAWSTEGIQDETKNVTQIYSYIYDLEVGRKYSFKVKSIKYGKESNWSEAETIEILSGSLYQPQRPTAIRQPLTDNPPKEPVLVSKPSDSKSGATPTSSDSKPGKSSKSSDSKPGK